MDYGSSGPGPRPCPAAGWLKPWPRRAFATPSGTPATTALPHHSTSPQHHLAPLLRPIMRRTECDSVMDLRRQGRPACSTGRVSPTWAMCAPRPLWTCRAVRSCSRHYVGRPTPHLLPPCKVVMAANRFKSLLSKSDKASLPTPVPPISVLVSCHNYRC